MVSSRSGESWRAIDYGHPRRLRISLWNTGQHCSRRCCGRKCGVIAILSTAQQQCRKSKSRQRCIAPAAMGIITASTSTPSGQTAAATMGTTKTGTTTSTTPQHPGRLVSPRSKLEGVRLMFGCRFSPIQPPRYMHADFEILKASSARLPVHGRTRTTAGPLAASSTVDHERDLQHLPFRRMRPRMLAPHSRSNSTAAKPCVPASTPAFRAGAQRRAFSSLFTAAVN